MLSVLLTLLGAGSTGGASLALKLAPYVIVALGAAAGAGILVHKVDSASYEKLELSIAAANAAATAAAVQEQKALDAVALSAAQRQNTTQTAIAAQARRQLAEVQIHVKDIGQRAPYGFVRVLVAAARGVEVNTLALPAGKSDDAASAYSWPALAGPLIADYAACRANGAQLGALIQVTRDFAKLKPQ
jgi:hypothetical protein